MPAKERSPRYPSIGLGQAIELTKRLYDTNGRTALPVEVIAKAWGYKSPSGPMRSKLGAVKSFGLLSGEKNKMRVSERALTLFIRSPESTQYQMALREAALEPPIFQELYEGYREAGSDALRHHLESDLGFTKEGAKQVAETYRETIALAGLHDQGYDRGDTYDLGEFVRTVNVPEPPRMIAPTVSHAPTENVYRMPLGRGMSAEVILSGGSPTADDIRRLRKYLELIEDALRTATEEAPE